MGAKNGEGKKKKKKEDDRFPLPYLLIQNL
jgi:hypothetical protein